jgi:lysozyme
MKIDKIGLALIEKYEGCKLEAYPDPATGGIPWTIGYGNTYYEDGTKVKKGDKITQSRADQLILNLLDHYEKGVDAMTIDNVTQNQFNALVSFAWNLGLQSLKSSTLLKKVNANPNDKSIDAEFAKWNRGNGKIMAGLVARRAAESKMYFS